MNINSTTYMTWTNSLKGTATKLIQEEVSSLITLISEKEI